MIPTDKVLLRRDLLANVGKGKKKDMRGSKEQRVLEIEMI